MNLFDIGLASINNIVPSIAITLNLFGKTTISNNGSAITTYTTVTSSAQVYPGNKQELKHKDYYNENTIYKKFLLNSNTLTGLNRNLNTAGDYIAFSNLTYKIVEVYNTYNTGWLTVIGAQSTDKVNG